MDVDNCSPVITDIPYTATLSATVPRRRMINSPVPTKIDEIIVNGWIEAMRCSSPPRKKKNIYFGHNHSPTYDADCGFRQWQVGYILIFCLFHAFVVKG
jgi:hypothetical protein